MGPNFQFLPAAQRHGQLVLFIKFVRQFHSFVTFILLHHAAPRLFFFDNLSYLTILIYMSKFEL